MITRFTAGENAPSATEAFDGKLILNQYGNLALSKFIADPFEVDSEVTLDTSVEPPVLRLRKAMTSTIFGELNAQGDFVQWSHEMNQGEHIVTGDYIGPQSLLDLE